MNLESLLMTVRFRALIQFVGCVVLFGFLAVSEGEPLLIVAGVAFGVLSAAVTVVVWRVFRGWFTRRGWHW